MCSVMINLSNIGYYLQTNNFNPNLYLILDKEL